MRTAYLMPLILSLSTFLCGSCISGIHLLGIDQGGVKDLKVTKDKYSEKIGETLADLHDAVIVPAGKIACGRAGDLWKVKWFNIGMGIEGKVGIAGVATLAAKPRIRLYFRKRS